MAALYPIPCNVNAAQTAQAAESKAVAAVKNAGLAGLASKGSITFSFTSQSCGGYRLIIKISSPTKTKTEAAVLRMIKVGTVNVSAKKRGSGRQLARKLKAAGQSATVQVITHVRVQQGVSVERSDTFTLS